MFLRTNGTLPSSWQGTNPLSSTGRPHIKDSAMVPGPALLMIMSLAVIHSGMLSTKPLIVTYSSTHMFTSRTAVSSARQQHMDEGSQTSQLHITSCCTAYIAGQLWQGETPVAVCLKASDELGPDTSATLLARCFCPVSADPAHYRTYSASAIVSCEHGKHEIRLQA